MRLLRVHIDHGWDISRETPWVLHDGDVRVDAGTAAANAWPVHDGLDAVVSAGQVRILAVALPRLPPARVSAAARFALEDQIAGGETDAHVAISAQRPDGTVLAIVCPRALVSAVASRKGPLARLRRVIAEPELAVPQRTWRWCRSANSTNDFVRVSNGEAFAVSAPDNDGALPPELALALTRAAPDAAAGVHVEWAAPLQMLERWQGEYHVPFEPGATWEWATATPQQFAASTDLLQGEFAPEARRPAPPLARAFEPAAWLLALALAVHVLSTLGEWTGQRVASWRTDGEWSALGLAAGLPREALGTPASASAALTKRHADLLHAQHRFARDDALPLLAHMSPIVGGLPPGSIRRATYADRHWTFETGLQDPGLLRDVERKLHDADLEALVVAAPGGARVRVGAPR